MCAGRAFGTSLLGSVFTAAACVTPLVTTWTGGDVAALALTVVTIAVLSFPTRVLLQALAVTRLCTEELV